ncbi:Hypothetical protein HDN1F_14110 [gamma proteobacterium HdN1]|nr:Hypothetical protein HDN1F_14110 [gamma proteobacterium HdN1]
MEVLAGVLSVALRSEETVDGAEAAVKGSEEAAEGVACATLKALVSRAAQIGARVAARRLVINVVLCLFLSSVFNYFVNK